MLCHLLVTSCHSLWCYSLSNTLKPRADSSTPFSSQQDKACEFIPLILPDAPVRGARLRPSTCRMKLHEGGEPCLIYLSPCLGAQYIFVEYIYLFSLLVASCPLILIHEFFKLQTMENPLSMRYIFFPCIRSQRWMSSGAFIRIGSKKEGAGFRGE